MKYLLTLSLFGFALIFLMSFFIPQLRFSQERSGNKQSWTSSIKRVTSSPETTQNSPSPKASQSVENTPPLARETQKPTSQTILGASVVPTEKKIVATPTPTLPPLSLTLLTPQGDVTTPLPSILITGKTVPDAEVFINEVTTKANGLGLFSYTYPLEEGENMISISANDVNGIYNAKEIVVTYNKL